MTAIASVPSLLDIDRTFLPIGRMRQIARVTELAGETIVGEVDLGSTHWVFPEHFPDDPIFPGVLMIEAAGQLVALWAWANGERGKPRLVRTGASFHAPVGPQIGALLLKGQVRRKRHLHFATVEISAAGVCVASVEAVLAVLPAT
jgi:3-hydroxymyristoyl/3-hydroxydecanoyl-(acyl carrier protein) dehydratase